MSWLVAQNMRRTVTSPSSLFQPWRHINICVVVEGRQACPGTSTALEHISAPFITLTVHSAVSVYVCVRQRGVCRPTIIINFELRFDLQLVKLAQVKLHIALCIKPILNCRRHKRSKGNLHPHLSSNIGQLCQNISLNIQNHNHVNVFTSDKIEDKLHYSVHSEKPSLYMNTLK